MYFNTSKIENKLTNPGCIVASIVIPPIEPIIDVINDSSDAINTFLRKSTEEAMEEILRIMLNITKSNVKRLDKILYECNKRFLENLMKTFAMFRHWFQIRLKITLKKKIDGADKIINVFTSNIQLKIGILYDKGVVETSKLLDEFIEKGARKVISVLEKENMTIYTLINNGIDKHLSPTEILRMLKYPNAEILASLLHVSADDLMRKIDRIWLSFIAGAKEVIKDANKIAKATEQRINHDGDLEIKRSMEAEVKGLLQKVRHIIRKYNALGVKRIKTIIGDSEDNLSEDIKIVIERLVKRITTFIKIQTVKSVKAVTTLIPLNNNSILNQMQNIMS